MQPVNQTGTPGGPQEKATDGRRGARAADRGGKCTAPKEQKLQNERKKEEGANVVPSRGKRKAPRPAEKGANHWAAIGPRQPGG